MKIYDIVFVSLLITSNKLHKLPSWIYCKLRAFFACKTFHSIQHYFHKTNIFNISWSFNSHFFYWTLIAANARVLKATAPQQENRFFFRKILFRNLTSSSSKGSYAIALKFSAKQMNLTKEKTVSLICRVMNINVGFEIFVKASQNVFLKKH